MMRVLFGFEQEIMQDNFIQLNRFKYNPPSAGYIAGFIDGDGCIFIRKINDGFQTGIQIAQSRTNVLLILQYHFGGTIRQNHMKRTNSNKNLRSQYVLNIRSNNYELILDYIYHHIIIKTCQIKSLYQISKYVNKIGMDENKNKYYEACSYANKHKSFDESHLVKMNIDYISGLFDAEGCLYIDKHTISAYRISISQKSHPEVLEYVKQYLGFGYVYNNSYIISSKNMCLNFIKLVENNLIVKYNQCQYFKKYLMAGDNHTKFEMYIKCNYEKHACEEFNHEMYNGLMDKNLYNYYSNFNKMRKKCLHIISTNDLINQLKPMTDEKEQKEQIIPKIEKNKIKRIKLTNEIILQVREQINSGKQNVEIENELNLKRHIVSRIKNNIIVLKNETKKNKIIKTQEQKNIEKRKISIQIILKIIDKLMENKLPSEVLNEILEENVGGGCKLTIDIVKNIKRKIKDKLIPFYDFEVSKDVYDHYVNLIK